MTNKFCVWFGCNSSSRPKKNGQFFNGKWVNFVKPSVDKQRANQWVKIMKRADFGLNNIKKHTYLCDKHFPPNVNLRWWENTTLTPIPENYQGHEPPAPVIQSASNPKKRKIPKYSSISATYESPDYPNGKILI